MDTLAWLIIRIAYAWMFIYPVKSLMQDWQGTKLMMDLLVPKSLGLQALTAAIMLVIMLFGGLMILFGVYAQIAGLILCIYSIIGYFIHTKLAQSAFVMKNKFEIKAHQDEILDLEKLAFIGHTTSAQKNFVLAAMGLMFFLLGSGPLSLTSNLF